MFGSSAAAKELSICFRCEAKLLRSSRTRLSGLASRTRQFATTQRHDIGSDVGRIVKGTSEGQAADEDRSSHGSRDSPLFASDDVEKKPSRRVLRLSTADAAHVSWPDRKDVYNKSGDESIRAQGVGPSSTHRPYTSDVAASYAGQTSSMESAKQEFKYPAFRHPDVASDRVELGVDRLGEPATIRVLPERMDRGRKKRSRRIGNDSKEHSQSTAERHNKTSFGSVVKSLDLEKQGAAGAAEAMNNIETIRRAFLDSVNQFDGATQAEVSELAKSLYKGFTTEQLKGYMTLAINIKPDEPDKLDRLVISDRYKVSQWYGGPSKWPEQARKRLMDHPNNEKRDETSSSSKSKSKMAKQERKQNLIADIIRRCWDIRSREERSQQGSVDMSVGQAWLELLLRQEQQVFYLVSENFKVKTEVSAQQGLVRITGAYDACVDAVRKIISDISAGQVQRINLRDTISGEHASKIQLGFLNSVISQPRFWNEIEDQTSTRITSVSSDGRTDFNEIDVHYLSEDASGLGGVMRRIRQFQKLLRIDTVGHECYPLLKHTRPVLIPAAISSSLSLTERYLRWYRLHDPHTDPLQAKDRASVAGDDGIAFERLVKTWSDLPIHAANGVAEESVQACWNTQPQTALAASLGLCVYAIPDDRMALMQQYLKEIQESPWNASTSAPFKSKLSEELSRYRRTLIHSMPKLINYLNSMAREETTLSNFFKIDLIPKAVSNGSVLLEHAPELQLYIDIDESNRSTHLRTARLLIGDRRFDCALVQQTLDVRFSAETYIDNSKDAFDPSISDFVKASKLDVWGTGRFTTPSTLTISIPQKVFALANPMAAAQMARKKSLHQGSIISAQNKDQMIVASPPEEDRQSAYSDESTTRPGLSSATDAKEAAQPGINSGLKHQSSTDSEDVQVEYVFDSLTVHSKLQSFYQGFPISLSTVEGGQVGGKREEVKLEIPGFGNDLINGINFKSTKDRDQGQMVNSRIDVARSYFTSYYRCISELISRIR